MACHPTAEDVTVSATLEMDMGDCYLDYPGSAPGTVVDPYEATDIIWYPRFTLSILVGSALYITEAEQHRSGTPASLCLPESFHERTIAGAVVITDYFSDPIAVELYREPFVAPTAPGSSYLDTYLLALPSTNLTEMAVTEVGGSSAHIDGGVPGLPVKGVKWNEEWKETAWSDPLYTDPVCAINWDRVRYKLDPDTGLPIGEEPFLFGRGTFHPLKIKSDPTAFAGSKVPAICHVGHWLRKIGKFQLTVKAGATFTSDNCGVTVCDPQTLTFDFAIPEFHDCATSHVFVAADDAIYPISYSHDA